MKPKNIDRPKEKTLSLPGSLVDQVDLMFYSEVEKRVPHGAWSKYIARLIRNDLEFRRICAVNKYGE